MRIATGLLLTTACWAQSSAIVSLSNGVQLRISAQGVSGSLTTELQPASGNSFFRIYRDENGLAVFAYEIAVDRTSDGTQFRVIARPAGSEFEERFPNADAGKPTPTFGEPRESGLLDSGSSFEIEVPSDPGLGQTITDTVQIQLNRRGTPPTEWSSPGAQLRFVTLKARIGDNMASPAGAGALVSGRYTMFYIPGRGGYFFSTEPTPGRAFAQIGVVDGTRLTFTLDNESYECESESPILLNADRGEIWVYHDPNYKPAGNWTKEDTRESSRDEFFTAASDSLNWWLPLK